MKKLELELEPIDLKEINLYQVGSYNLGVNYFVSTETRNVVVLVSEDGLIEVLPDSVSKNVKHVGDFHREETFEPIQLIPEKEKMISENTMLKALGIITGNKVDFKL